MMALEGGYAPGPCKYSPTPPVDRMTHTCENFTFPQLRGSNNCV